jgi:uncharacterized protein (TIGR03435 family)
VRGFPLASYLFFAYKITGDQSRAMLSQLPGWATTDRFDIEAKTDGDPAKDTKDQMRLMVQSLLAERFGLVARYETKQVPVFALTLDKPGKTGPQLKAHPGDVPCSSGLQSAGGPEPNSTVAGGFSGSLRRISGNAAFNARSNACWRTKRNDRVYCQSSVGELRSASGYRSNRPQRDVRYRGGIRTGD